MKHMHGYTWRRGLALMIVCLLAAPATAQPAAIEFEARLETARVLAEADDKPIAVYFTADWCAWCRKMSTSTFTDAAVTAHADKFIWAKVDVEADPVVPAIFGIRTVPTLLVITADGWMIAGHDGYATPGVMQTFLADALAKADAPLDPAVADLLDRTRQADGRSVRQVIEALAQPDRVGRTILVSLIVDLGPQAYPALLDAMADEKLAIRAAAADVLAVATQAKLPFDAFADEPIRTEQLAAWRAHVETLPDESTTTTDQPAENANGPAASSSAEKS